MKFKIFTAMLSMLLISTHAQAAYPEKPIQLVVPFAPGGATDIVARTLSAALSKNMQQPVVVVNKPGAGALIGATMVAKSPADGYTILLTPPGPQITNPFLMDNISFDPLKDLKPVSLVAVVPSVLVVNKDFTVRSVKELIKYAKEHPRSVNFSSSGIGSSSHLSGELFKQRAGIDMVHVPYRGSGAALTDLLAGQVQMAIDSYVVYKPYIDSGELRVIAAATQTRLEQLPDVPTLSEEIPGLATDVYLYMTVPGGTPAPIIDQLGEKIRAALKEPELQKLFIQRGMIAMGSTPAELSALIDSERVK